jgi:general nucleoside transport system ATP-binding protein
VSDAITSAALKLTHIVKRFGHTTALADATLAVRRGTVHALLGENGAGKTTLMRIANGMLSADAGAFVVNGRTAHFKSPRDAIAAGIGMVHQHFTNIPAMTVAENVALGKHGRFSRAIAEREVEAVASRTGLALDPGARVAELPVAAQQRLEILKALSRHARLLILDEPTAVLAPVEAEQLLAWLRAFALDGATAILITHKLREALAIADDITVLRGGRTVLSTAASETDAGSLAAAMLGEAPPVSVAPNAAPLGAVLVNADRITIRDSHGLPRISDATLQVRGGEILGVAGVETSGHHLLLRAIAGRVPVSSGHLERPARVGFIPEDRLRDALIANFSLVENVALKGAGARTGRMEWKHWRAVTADVSRANDVRASGPDAPASTLSGGNQQKLVVARELHDDPGVLIAENPTRGLDVRASAAVHERLRSASAQGMAVVVSSSDLDEMLSLATRVVAVHGGVVREVALDRAIVGRAMLGLV